MLITAVNLKCLKLYTNHKREGYSEWESKEGN